MNRADRKQACPHCGGTAVKALGPVKSKTYTRKGTKTTVSRFVAQCLSDECGRGFFVPRNVIDPRCKSTLIARMRVERRYDAAEAAGASEEVLERITDDALALEERRQVRQRYEDVRI